MGDRDFYLKRWTTWWRNPRHCHYTCYQYVSGHTKVQNIEILLLSLCVVILPTRMKVLIDLHVIRSNSLNSKITCRHSITYAQFLSSFDGITEKHIDGLVQERRNFRALTIGLHLAGINQSMRWSSCSPTQPRLSFDEMCSAVPWTEMLFHHLKGSPDGSYAGVLYL